MRKALLLLAIAAFVPALVSPTSAATKAERCEKYAEELAKIEKAKARGGSEARMHKLESKRQKILAAKAKHHC